MFDRQFELYSGFAFAFPEIDVSQNDFENFENKTSEEQEKEIAVLIKYFLMYLDLTNIVETQRGVKFDLTDDRIDPRVGVRLQHENYGFEGEGLTNFKVENYSLTTYMPNNDLSMEKTSPFNWILEKGVFTALQLAFFYEFG